MSLNADHMLDRRKLQRRVSFWRILAFVIAIVAVIALGLSASRDQLGAQIARVEIEGVITDDWETRELLRKIGETDRVKGVILSINSPGGTTAGGEALYDSIRQLNAKKPIVASISTLGASAAYLAAIGTERIFVRETSITGSIGVIFQWTDLQDAADKIGVDVNAIRSDDLKAQPSPFEDASPEALAVIEQLIGDTDEWFERLVAERRGLSPLRASSLADGRVYSGARAIELSLADEIGGEREARDWLVANRDVPADAKIRTWSKDDALSGFGPGAWLVRSVVRGLGLEGSIERLESLVPLDGLVSLWHPQALDQ